MVRCTGEKDGTRYQGGSVSRYVDRFERNTLGTDYCVGDIHGMFRKLQTELDRIGFDPTVDRLFSVGDLVDRGPDSNLCLEWIAKPWFHAVQGNHEDMAIRFPNGNMDSGNYAANGGAWNIANTPDKRQEYSDCLALLPIAIQVETEHGTVGIVHADVPFPTWRDFVVSLEDSNISKSMHGSIIDAAMWSRERITAVDKTGIHDVRAVIVGHTPLQNPVVLGNVHHIDTGACFQNGRFTIINLATLETV